MEETEFELVCGISDGLTSIKEQLEDFNIIHFNKLLLTLSELNIQLKRISDSLELISNN